MHLPYRDSAFDAATISFGLRNIHDRMAGLRELLRWSPRPGASSRIERPVPGPINP